MGIYLALYSFHRRLQDADRTGHTSVQRTSRIRNLPVVRLREAYCLVTFKNETDEETALYTFTIVKKHVFYMFRY